MKRYNLIDVEQNGKIFYVLVTDPKIIVRLIQDIEAGQEQESQRPWIESRVREIAKYVAGKFKEDNTNIRAAGLIPNTPILNIKNLLSVEKDANGYYIELPETENEFSQYKNTIEVIDGQHRIRAFMPEYIDVDFAANRKYEMVFNVFNQLSLKEKREIFMITNEKQVKIPTNLLRLFKKWLNLLTGDEDIFELVETLNNEDFSPLKGRIMIGANKIPKGYQESQISKIINKSTIYEKLNGRNFDLTKMAKIISNYLYAWERIYNVKFSDPGKDTITKISGLRYILYLLMPCLEILENKEKRATVDEFAEIIENLKTATDIEDVFTDPSTSLSFRGETATIQMAKEHGLALQTYIRQHQNHFNVAEGI